MGACVSKQPQKQQKRKKVKQFKQPSIVNDLPTREVEQQGYQKKTKRQIDQKSFQMVQQFLDSCKEYRIETHVPSHNHRDSQGSFCQSVAREFQEYCKSIEIDNFNDQTQKKQRQHTNQEKHSNPKQLQSINTQQVKSIVSTSQNSIQSQSKNHHFLKSYFQLQQFVVEVDFL